MVFVPVCQSQHTGVSSVITKFLIMTDPIPLLPLGGTRAGIVCLTHCRVKLQSCKVTADAICAWSCNSPIAKRCVRCIYAALKSADAKAQRGKETQRKARKSSRSIFHSITLHLFTSLYISLRSSALSAPLRQNRHVGVTVVILKRSSP